jgi:hypothetical protein
MTERKLSKEPNYQSDDCLGPGRGYQRSEKALVATLKADVHTRSIVKAISEELGQHSSRAAGCRLQAQKSLKETKLYDSLAHPQWRAISCLLGTRTIRQQ